MVIFESMRWLLSEGSGDLGANSTTWTVSLVSAVSSREFGEISEGIARFRGMEYAVKI